MLQAKSSEGRLVTLATLSKKEIEVERSKEFFCPLCYEQVIIKAGNKVIPHFAHQSKRHCPSGEGGEGAYHEKGKLLLYNWLRSQHLDVKLEKHIKKINQRPDLLLQVNQRQIAIEYQCARVPIDQIRLRNEGYRKVNIIPIWILGANRFKRKTSNELQIDEYTLQFIHRFSSQSTSLLYYLCPETSRLLTFQHIYTTNNRQAFGKLSFSQLNRLQFQDMFNERKLSNIKLYMYWAKKKQNFRVKQRSNLYGRELTWHQWLYEKQTHLQYLPSIVHLPVSMQWQMKSPLWDWQSRLVIDLLEPLPLNSYFSINTCKHVLKGHLNHQRLFPLNYSSECPIRQYLLLLERLEIIEQTSIHHFKKIRPILFHKNIKASLNGDKSVMNKLIVMDSIK